MGQPACLAALFLSGLAILLASCGPTPSNAPANASPSPPPPPPLTASPAPARYACVSVKDGAPVECIVDAAADPAAVQRLRQACGTSPEQTFTQTCPSDGLIGCCTIPYTDGTRREVCYYPAVRGVANPQTCAGDGGVWSAQP